MSAGKGNLAIIGLGAAACAACCAGPILGLLAAIGVGTATGFAVFGGTALVVGALAIVVVLGRRRHRLDACSAGSAAEPVSVPIGRAPR